MFSTARVKLYDTNMTLRTDCSCCSKRLRDHNASCARRILVELRGVGALRLCMHPLDHVDNIAWVRAFTPVL